MQLRATPLLVVLLLAMPAFAAEVDPGEWEFTATSTSRLFPGPQMTSFKRCIKKDDAANPDRWMAQQTRQGDCKVTPGAKSADTYTWVMECAKPSMRGTGSARLSRASIEGETHMTGEVHGQKFELRTKVSGKRLGPCKG
ncbi:MAG TPA: DUF3617 family protein [Burkholderiales bacterium]|nr:DUF3617 family protein [Burkholderiales bacterium]